MTDYSSAKTGEYLSDIRQFLKLCMLRKRFESQYKWIASVCWDICPWSLSVLQSSQFSSTYSLGKPLASQTVNVHRQVS